MRTIAERLPAPLMTFAPADGFRPSSFPGGDGEAGLPARGVLGHRFRGDGEGGAAVLRGLAQDRLDPFLGAGGAEREMKAAHKVTGLERLLEIERRTMKDA